MSLTEVGIFFCRLFVIHSVGYCQIVSINNLICRVTSCSFLSWFRFDLAACSMSTTQSNLTPNPWKYVHSYSECGSLKRMHVL